MRQCLAVARVTLSALAICLLVGSSSSAQSPQPVLEGQLPSAAAAALAMEKFPTNTNAKLWQLSLNFDGEAPEAARLEIFKGDPGSGGRPVCRTLSATSTTDECFVDATMVSEGGLWARVSADIDPGRGAVPYRVLARPLTGVPFAGTDLYSGDATLTISATTAQRAAFARGRTTTEHAYRFSGQPHDLIIADVEGEQGALITMSLHAPDGRLIIGSYNPASQQALVLPAEVSSGYVVIRGQSTAAELDAVPEYTVKLSSGEGVAAIIESHLANGYAFRYSLPGDTYGELVRLGNPQADAEGRPQAAVNALTFLGGLIGPSVSSESYDPDEQQPVVVFVGVGGQSTIVQLRRKRDSILGLFRSRAGQLDPGVETLGRARQFWAVYVEDDQSSFETSIDVQFSERAPQADFEAFNPLSGSRVLSTGQTDSAPRMVRIGLRRFRVRTPPVAVQVAFTRQGPTYGLRQWRRVFRILGWGPLGFSLGMFIPATEISVARHEVIERDCQVTTVVCQPGEDALISQRFFRRQVFGVAMVQLYGARSRFVDATNRKEKVLALLPPNLIFGIGLPPTFDNVGYAGVSWPLAWNRLQATIGSTFAKPERRVPLYKVGQRVPLDTPRESLFTKDHWVSNWTFGLSIDIYRER